MRVSLHALKDKSSGVAVKFVATLIVAVLMSAFQLTEVRALTSQNNDRLTPVQAEIQRQRQRLASGNVEEKRDALMRLGNLKRPDASRAAAAGLNDPIPIVRVTAVHAIGSLPQKEASDLLIPLLQDKIEFVRRETANELGEVRSQSSLEALSNLLISDKEAAVRAASAIALGKIGDDSAVTVLVRVLNGETAAKGKTKRARENEFVLRAAARSLGQLRNRAAVPTLIATLNNESAPGDLRREAARALGLIGDPAAEPALRGVLTASDPYLSNAASEALRRLQLAKH